MKKIHLALLLCLLMSLLTFSCKPENTYPSPLADITVSDLTFEANETNRTLDLKTRLIDVEATVTDMKTGGLASWITIEVNNTTLKFTLTENITIYDRKALVKLRYVGTRTDLEGATETSFYVEQYKNKAFEDLDIKDLQMDYQKKDSVITTGLKLENIKPVITDLEGNTLNWCKVQISEGTNLLIHVEENLSNSQRMALVRLAPSQQQALPESDLAQKLFLITQDKNPVLDSLNFGTVEVNFEAGDTVLKTDRELKNIQGFILNATNKETCSWAWIKSIAGDSIILHVNMLSSTKDRSANVTIYRPNNGTTIDSTTIVYTFSLKQKHNDVLEGKTIPAQQMAFDQTTDTIKVNYSLKGFKALLTDSLTGTAPTWLQTVVKENEIILKASSKNLMKSDRKATVTIYQPNGSDVIDSTTVSYSFKVTQLHNDALEGKTIPAQQMTFDQAADTIKLDFSLKGFKTALVDNRSGIYPQWLAAEVKDTVIILKATKKNMARSDREATVTVYQPNNGTIIDENTISTSFTVTHLHNSTTDKLTISNREIEANQNKDSIAIDCSLAGFKALVIDKATTVTANWIWADVKEHKIYLNSSSNYSNEKRSALITIYQPNNDAVYKDTIKHTFLVTQKEKKRLETENSNLEESYVAHSVDVIVTSNVKYAVHEDSEWILGYKMTNIDELHEKLTFDLSENQTSADRNAVITLSGGDLTTTISITQKTNPTIEFVDIETDNLLFGKGQSNFILKVKTLTPNYNIHTTANPSWISISKKNSNSSPYQHNISISAFTGNIGDRIDTIIVKNFSQEKRLVIKQVNYLAISTTKAELEEGNQLQLECENITGKELVWSSSNTKVATVSQNGQVTAVSSGRTIITASVGSFGNIGDYNEICEVTVYNAADKLNVSLDKENGSFSNNSNYYTTNCPMVIKNTINSKVAIDNVTVYDYNNNIIQNCSSETFELNMDESKSLPLNISNVYSPYVIINLTWKDKKYQKKVYIWNL